MDDGNLRVPGVFAPEPDDAPVWFGILFTDGSITVKRYFDYGDLSEADSSTFVKATTILFKAENRKLAMAEGTRLMTAHVL